MSVQRAAVRLDERSERLVAALDRGGEEPWVGRGGVGQADFPAKTPAMTGANIVA
jgi:hypothetical protein